MDPVSIAGAVGPTLKTLYSVTTTLYTFVTSAKKVDKSLENLHVDVRGLTRVLEDIDTNLKDVNIAQTSDAAPGTEGAWDPTYNAIHDTRHTVQDLQGVLDRLGPPDRVTNAFKKTVKQVQLNLNSDEIGNIRSRIQWHTTVLQMALQTATLAINCLTNDHLINIVNPKIDRMLPLVPRVESLMKQVELLSSQLNAKLDKLPKDFRNPHMMEYSQQLKRTAEAAIVTASTTIASQSTIMCGKNGQQSSSSSSGKLSEDLRTRKINEWFSHLTVNHEERGPEYETLSELTPDDSVSRIGFITNKRSQQIIEAGMPWPSSGAGESAGTPTSMNAGRKASTKNLFGEEFANSSHNQIPPRSRDKSIRSGENEFGSDSASENTLTEYRADKVDTPYDEKSAKELLALLGTNPGGKERNVNDLLLDLAKMEIGQGVKSISSIVGTLLYLLDMGANVNALDISHSTPLHHASETGNTAVVEVLVQRGADADIKDHRGRTALHIAAMTACTPVVESLLKSGVAADQQPRSHPFNALAQAISYGRTSTVKCLLKAGASFDIRDLHGFRPLHYASYKGRVGIVEVLLEAGAPIDARDDGTNTPLIWASCKGHVEVVEMLLKAGASVDAEGYARRSPLIWATDCGQVGVVERLLKAGAAPNSKTGYGVQALMSSAYRGLKQITELLLAAGADIRASSDYGYTTLHAALFKHSWDCAKESACDFCTGSETRQNMLKLLCEKGADPSAKDDGGYSPLSLVYTEGYSESEQEALAKVLQSYGAR